MTSKGFEADGVGSFDELCAQTTAFFGRRADPFDQFQMIVPRPVYSRALAQRLGTELGICAGIDFLSMNRFIYELKSAAGIADEFWQIPKLAGRLHTLLALNMGETWFRPVENYLRPGEPRPGRTYSTAIRIAKLFKRYRSVTPALLDDWADGNLVDPAGSPLDGNELWQAKLFHQLLSQEPSALNQDELLIERIDDRLIENKRLGVFTLSGLDPTQLRILRALDAHNDVHWWQLQQVHPESQSSLRDAYGSAELAATALLPPTPRQSLANRSSLLGMIQHDLMNRDRTTTPRIADGSVMIHASHGPDRQTEVLREVLCTLFEDDPTLEPRDVVILCHDLRTYAPLLAANFCLPVESSHPGNRLRLRVTSQQQSSLNPLLNVLNQLTQIINGRAGVSDLLEILANPVVMARFELDEVMLSSLRQLLAETNTNWGVDHTTRERFDVPVPNQGTWLHSVNRLLAGVVFSDQATVDLGNVLPFHLVETGDLKLLGSLAEFVSRVRKTMLDFAVPAPMNGWRTRFIGALEMFTKVDQNNDWFLDNAIETLDSLGDDSTVLLSLPDFQAAFDALISSPPPRPYFLTGSLDVAGINEFTGLPYRVICLLGLDDGFPPAELFDGDDLTNGHPVPSLQQARIQARQDLLTAILSTSEKLVVITKGADPITNKQLDAPIPILDLLKACDVPAPAGSWRDPEQVGEPIVIHHSLQPFTMSNFTGFGGVPISFDDGMADGANAQLGSDNKSPAWLTTFPATDESSVNLSEFIKFFIDPAAALVATVGIPKAEYRIELETELPVEVDPLQRWKIGDQLVRSLLSGKTTEESRNELLLTGLLPVGVSGERYLRSVSDEPGGLLAQAESIALRVASLTQTNSPHTETIELHLGKHTVVGDLRFHGNQLVQYGFGGIRSKHLLESWIRLLCAVAAGHPEASAAILKSRSKYLSAPTPGQAQEILAGLLQLRESGLRQVLPFPAQISLDMTQTAMGKAYLIWQRQAGSFAFTSAGSPGDKWAYLTTQSPAWARFFSSVDELLAPQSLSSDPGHQPGVPRLAAVADWFWKPLGQSVIKEFRR